MPDLERRELRFSYSKVRFLVRFFVFKMFVNASLNLMEMVKAAQVNSISLL